MSLDSQKLENGWTDLANFGSEIFMEVQEKFKWYENMREK